jgi:hypothetical protein
MLCPALTGYWLAQSPALVQQKTVKTCAADWKASKTDNQAKGITERSYVDQCRAAAVQPTTAPAAAKPAAPTVAAPTLAPERAGSPPAIKPAPAARLLLE